MPDILAGARRYAAYVVINPKMMMNPVRWLEEQRWRDSWTITTSKSTTGRAKATTTRSKAATRPAAGTRTRTTARPATATTTGTARPPAKTEPKHQVVTTSAPAAKAPTAEEVAAREAARIREAQVAKRLAEEEAERSRQAEEKRAQFRRDYQAERDQTFPPWPAVKAMENAQAFYDATRPNRVYSLHDGIGPRDIAMLDLVNRLISGSGEMTEPNSEYRTSLQEFLEWHQAQEQTMPGGEHAR
jgi:hypothetical protein